MVDVDGRYRCDVVPAIALSKLAVYLFAAVGVTMFFHLFYRAQAR